MGTRIQKQALKTMLKWLILIILISLLIYIYLINRSFKITHYTIENDAIPKLRVVQISDVHQRDAKTIYPKVIELNPDIVVFTGDLFDSYKDSFDNVETLISNINAPMYFVSGNHENRNLKQYSKMKELLEKYNVIILEDEVIQYQNINIAGIQDSWFETNGLEKLKLDNHYTILLSHRPELFEQYVEKNIDLVLTGHIHGGLLQLPFVHAVFSPNKERFFPKYYQGVYTKNNTTMIVSTGLGDSFPRFRINVACELVVIDINM